MKYYHRNYFFLLIASALNIVLWLLMYTTSRFRTRFSLMMEVDVYKRQFQSFNIMMSVVKTSEQV